MKSNARVKRKEGRKEVRREIGIKEASRGPVGAKESWRVRNQI